MLKKVLTEDDVREYRAIKNFPGKVGDICLCYYGSNTPIAVCKREDGKLYSPINCKNIDLTYTNVRPLRELGGKFLCEHPRLVSKLAKRTELALEMVNNAKDMALERGEIHPRRDLERLKARENKEKNKGKGITR